MSDLPNKYRGIAAESQEAAATLLAATSLTPKNQIIAVAGLVKSDLYHALADVVEEMEVLVLTGADGDTESQLLLKQRQKNAHDIRMAAAKGDWDEYDRIAKRISDQYLDRGNEITGGSTTGGDDQVSGTDESDTDVGD